MKFVRNADIEILAEQRLAEYERRFGEIIKPPVPLEKVLAQIYGLTVLWDRVEELSNEVVLGVVLQKFSNYTKCWGGANSRQLYVAAKIIFATLPRDARSQVRCTRRGN